jgi:hypothetical protein
VNLHQHHDLSISKAYASAIAQFRALRAEQEVANATAALEAEAYGGSFGQTEIERNFEREGKALQTWTRGASHLDEGEVAARKRWKAGLHSPLARRRAPRLRRAHAARLHAATGTRTVDPGTSAGPFGLDGVRAAEVVGTVPVNYTYSQHMHVVMCRRYTPL